MSNLRQELEHKKLAGQDMVSEAAESWVQDNIILISEKLNRSAVTKLTNSILKFDEKFGPFKSKLPEVQEIIDNAETGLQLVLTGKTSESRATDMLRKLSMIYTLLSEFFSSDLAAMLRTPLFRAAKANPDTRLDSITDPSHSPKSIMSAFSNALRPSKDELKMLGRVYKNIAMPSLRADSIAKQLLSMTFAELSEISTMEKVPMVAVEKEPAGVPFEEPKETLEEDGLSEQAKKTDSLAQTTKMLDSLGVLLNAVPELKAGLGPAVGQLRAAALKAVAGGRLGALMDQGPMAMFRDPEGKVLAQGQMAIELFRKLGQSWTKIAPLFADEEFTPEEQAQLTKILQKELEGGLLDKLKNAFKIPPFPGLAPADVIQVVTGIAAQNAQTKETGTAVAGSVQEAGALNEDLGDLRSFFTRLNTTFRPQRSWFDDMTSRRPARGGAGGTGQGIGTNRTNPTSSTNSTNPTAPGERVGQPTETRPTQGTGAIGAQPGFFELSADASDEQLKAITKATGVEEDRLRKLAQTRGVRVSVDPKFLAIK